MKKNLLRLLLCISVLGNAQEVGNIDLQEVVNTATIVPKIEIDNLIYSMRDRDKIISEILRSPFWENDFKFTIDLEDYDTGKKYTYENDGRVRISINDIELTNRHNFKTLKSIKNILINCESIQIISKNEVSSKIDPQSIYEISGQILYKTETKDTSSTLIKIKSKISTEISYNKPLANQKIKTLSDFKSVDKAKKVYVDLKSDIVKKNRLDKIEDVEDIEYIEEDGIVYSPKLINGEIFFKKNTKLTRLAKIKERYKKMGLNEWGIDPNATTWDQALRAFPKRRYARLWVVDGIVLCEPPPIRSFAHVIREVNVIPKYSAEASKYGIIGSKGVIKINTMSSGYQAAAGNYKRSFELKGKKNIELIKEFQNFEKQFLSKIYDLEDKKNLSIELNDQKGIDSIQKLLDNLMFKSYMFTTNFAINNSDHEVAPYLALKKIADARLILLEAIEEKLTEEVKKSKYGKKFLKFLESRREKA